MMQNNLYYHVFICCDIILLPWYDQFNSLSHAAVRLPLH